MDFTKEYISSEKFERVSPLKHDRKAVSSEEEHRKHTILFVDDEKSVLKSLKRAFIDEAVHSL